MTSRNEVSAADAMKEHIQRNELTGASAQNAGDATTLHGSTSKARLIEKQGSVRTGEPLQVRGLMVLELKAILKETALLVSGKKADLIKRLETDLARKSLTGVQEFTSHVKDVSHNGRSGRTGSAGSFKVQLPALVGASQNHKYLGKSLDAYKVRELKAILKEQGLSTSGVKADLVTRLATEIEKNLNVDSAAYSQ